MNKQEKDRLDELLGIFDKAADDVDRARDELCDIINEYEDEVWRLREEVKDLEQELEERDSDA